MNRHDYIPWMRKPRRTFIQKKKRARSVEPFLASSKLTGLSALLASAVAIGAAAYANHTIAELESETQVNEVPTDNSFCTEETRTGEQHIYHKQLHTNIDINFDRRTITYSPAESSGENKHTLAWESTKIIYTNAHHPLIVTYSAADRNIRRKPSTTAIDLQHTTLDYAQKLLCNPKQITNEAHQLTSLLQRLNIELSYIR